MSDEKIRKAAMERYYKKKAKMLEFLGGKCVKCDSTSNLEIDHIDWKEKKFTITNRTNLSWEKLKLELDKCQLLCEKCHDQKSIDDRREQITGFREQPHGTYTRYRFYKCRCDECTKANSAYIKKSKGNKPITDPKKL